MERKKREEQLFLSSSFPQFLGERKKEKKVEERREKTKY
jgi:hypothetical protein